MFFMNFIENERAMKGCTHFEFNVNETSYAKTYSMMIYLGVMSAMLLGKFIFYLDLETGCTMEKKDA